jgi:hypothetical protein
MTCEMSMQSEIDVAQKERRTRVAGAGAAAILLAALAIALVAGVFFWHSIATSPPSAKKQSAEVAALETHVLPLVKNLRATWYLNEGSGSGSIKWKRGNFTNDPSRALQDGDALFDNETEASYEQFAQAIRASGVPTNRLRDAQFAADGTLRSASFQRRGGGLKFVFTYIYSAGAKPPEWTSNLGPVVLTRIGDSDWWFEQSPND